MTEIHPRALELAPDLTTSYPRAPRDMLAGYIIAPRALDKCRAHLAGKTGPYNFDGFMDNLLFSFTGLKGDDFKTFVATGADDVAIAKWIEEHATKRPRVEIIKWNNEWRYKRLSEMPDRFQQFMDRYISHTLPPGTGSRLTYLFDIFDVEEGRPIA